MPCTYCNVSFSIIKWKNRCQTCFCTFCTNCIIEKRCLACYNVLCSHLQYDRLMKVKVKDLKLYSSVRGLPVNTCKEKTELVSLILQNSNGSILTQQKQKQNGSYENASPDYPRMPRNTRPENTFNSHLPYPPRGPGSMPQPQRFPDVFHQPPGYNRTQEAFPTAHEFFTDFTDSSQIHVQDNVRATAKHTPQPKPDPEPTSNTSANFNTGTQPKKESDTKQGGPPKPVPTGNGNKLLISDLTSAAQIDKLSVREMKQILADNFVDYKGCVERSELLSRVKNLYKDRVKNEEKLAEEESGATVEEGEDNTCRICWDKPIDCVLLECGHMVTCTSCGKKMNECPMCRQYVVRCVHVFRT